MEEVEIREMRDEDSEEALNVINEAAKAYREVLRPEAYREPQMSCEEFEEERGRIKFFVAEVSGEIIGVGGYEYVRDAALVRHVYVKPRYQRRGVGTAILKHLERLITSEGRVEKIIVGTYREAYWAIAFYSKHGYRLVERPDEVLRKYYSIPDVQRENSVALWKPLLTKSLRNP